MWTAPGSDFTTSPESASQMSVSAEQLEIIKVDPVVSKVNMLIEVMSAVCSQKMVMACSRAKSHTNTWSSAA